MEKLTDEQIKDVKGKGFLLNRGTNQFSGRVITENGILSSEQMEILSKAAHKFGNGTLAFTVRLTVELPGIDFENIENFRQFIASKGLKTGGTGSKVRPIVACKGTTCVFGLCDTQGLATEIHKRFYEGYSDVVLPHKFKIGVGGCPNNCAKPDLNDIGIIGQRKPIIDAEKCKNCKNCTVVKSCPMEAVAIENDKIKILKSECNNCGRCIDKCPFGAMSASGQIYKIYIGGRWGKKIRIGSGLSMLFEKDEALKVIEKAILFFKKEGKSGERFGATIDRIGIKFAEKMLCSNDLIAEKNTILGIETKAGAKC